MNSGVSSAADRMWSDKLKSSLEELNFYFFSSSFFTIDFKICLYARCVDNSHYPHDILWLHFANSSKLWENKNVKLFSQSFEELAKCSHNMSCGQCEVSTHLAYRHILKSIVKKLEEKNQKFSSSKLDLSLSDHMRSAVLLPPGIVGRKLRKRKLNLVKDWLL